MRVFDMMAMGVRHEGNTHQHAKQEKYDQKRTLFLQSRGYQVLRFWNNDVLGNSEGVLETILQACNK